MSSELTSIVAALRFNNYVSLVIATAVTFDYIITFPKEIRYIWKRSWSIVTAMYVLVRYLGLAVALIEGLYGSTFIPGPDLAALLFASDCAFIVFLASADFIMILRVYAMYDRSKTVLGCLLVFYVATIALYSISVAYYDNFHNNQSVATQVLNMSFCEPIYNITSKVGKYKVIPRLTLAALMFVLVLARLCMDSFRAYRATKRWKTNECIHLLAREGTLYFLAHLLNNITFGQSTPGTIAAMLSFIVMFVLSPRFVMSVRELYDLRVDRRGSGIDTGFGLASGRVSCVTDVSVEFAHSHSLVVTSEAGDEMQVLRSGDKV